MDTEYILKIVRGEVPQEERDHFFSQVAADRELADEYARVKNRYIFETLPYTVSSGTIFDDQKRGRRVLNILSRGAAVLFIPFFAYFIYDILSPDGGNDSGKMLSYESAAGVRYSVNNGVKADLVLPDSTRVWLNSGSYLDVPGDFTRENRRVSLSGEGYFSVETDEKYPFFIDTPKDIVVRVTGTEFNLSCYEDDKSMKLTLLKGSLELIRDRGNAVINVRPNEQIEIDYESSREKLDVSADTGYATAWKEGSLRFDNTPMDEVVRRLGRWYGINIIVGDPAIYRHSFTAEFESESVLQVLGLMKITMGIDYETEGNTVKLNMQPD